MMLLHNSNTCNIHTGNTRCTDNTTHNISNIKFNDVQNDLVVVLDQLWTSLILFIEINFDLVLIIL